MQKEAAKKLMARDRRELFLAVVASVSIGKGDAFWGHIDKSVVRDSDSVGVATKIFKHPLRTTERGL